MQIGIDYRPVTAAPYSGIARQVLALEAAILANPKHTLIRFTACPLEHPHRQTMVCPSSPSPVSGLHRPQERYKFEVGFLPDAIRAHSLDLYIATANTGLPIWGAPENTKYVLLLHDVFQLTMRNYHQSLLKAKVYRLIDWLGTRFSASLAHAIWTPSVYSATEIKRLFSFAKKKVHVLPNAVPYQPAQQSLALPGGVPAPYWLVVGTREPRKNIPWFVQHWAEARQRSAAIPALVLVGHQEDIPVHLRQLAGLQFISGVSDETLCSLYQHAHRLWQPSYAEGFGLPVVEALGQGTSVCVATGSSLDEVAPPNAIRFSPVDGAALVQQMLALADTSMSDSDDATLRESNQAWAKTYDLPAYAQRLEALIQQLERS